MERDYRFDIARVACMTFIVAFVHLFSYFYNKYVTAYYLPGCAVLTDACLGLFTFASGYLLGKKYNFNKLHEVGVFYKKRLLRIIPLFLVASVVLYWIGFNNGRATMNGLLCISPFVEPRPMTLWYIPVILFCYLFTPFVCRKGFLWRLFSALGIIFAVFFFRMMIPSIDLRFLFNIFFYFVGLVSAPYFDWKFSKTPWLKWVIVALLLVFLFIDIFYTPGAPGSIYESIFAGVGVFAFLIICQGLSGVVFKKGKNDILIAEMVKNVSYASMTVYMFHRFFFWGGEMLWNPSSPVLKLLYMDGVVFPVMIVLSYYIQRGYDLLVERIKLK